MMSRMDRRLLRRNQEILGGRIMFKGIKKYLHENQEMITMGLLALPNGFHFRPVDMEAINR